MQYYNVVVLPGPNSSANINQISNTVAIGNWVTDSPILKSQEVKQQCIKTKSIVINLNYVVNLNYVTSNFDIFIKLGL